VAHKEPGIGQIGAGVLNAPVLPFQKAFEGFAKSLEHQPAVPDRPRSRPRRRNRGHAED
jgi:hypothetical protein